MKMYRLIDDFVKTAELLFEENDKSEKEAVYFLKRCLDNIHWTVKYSNGVSFDFKENETLLRNNHYGDVLLNIRIWLKKSDSRYDGFNWSEK